MPATDGGVVGAVASGILSAGHRSEGDRDRDCSVTASGRKKAASGLMELRPISIKAASVVVRDLHRHLKPPQGARFAIAAWHEGRLVGVAMVGNPIARMAADGKTAEVIRVATDGTRNASSFLYGKAKRAAQALGFTRVTTKTRPEESGASLRAVGATLVGKTRKQPWSRINRPRRDEAGPSEKLSWEL